MGVISVDQLVTNLEIQRAKFTTSDCCVLDSEERRYERMVALMQDAADQRSRGSEWRRRKAVQTLLEIAAIGAEVFFLSTLVTKVSHLVILDERDIIGAFRTWWSCAPRASSLTEVARQLWETYSLDQIVPTRGRKRTLQEAQLEAGKHPFHSFFCVLILADNTKTLENCSRRLMTEDVSHIALQQQ